MKPSGHTLKGIILSAAAMGPRLTACLLAVILVSLVLGVLPPLILQQAIDSLTAGSATARGTALPGSSVLRPHRPVGPRRFGEGILYHRIRPESDPPYPHRDGG